MSVPRILENAWRAAEVQSVFRKVTKGNSAFYNSIEESATYIVMFGKEAFLEISGNVL